MKTKRELIRDWMSDDIPFIAVMGARLERDERQLNESRDTRKLALAKAKYNRLHALYTAHPTEGSRLALIAALDRMRDIERAMR